MSYIRGRLYSDSHGEPQAGIPRDQNFKGECMLVNAMVRTSSPADREVDNQNEECLTSRRSVITATGALSTAALAGCTSMLSSGSSSPTEVVVSGYGGTWGEWEREVFWNPWEEKTGNTVTKQKVSGLKLITQIKSNKDKTSINMGHLFNPRITPLGAQGHVIPVEDKLENFSQVSDAGKGKYYAAQNLSPFGIGYNTNEVDVDVNSWEDLLNPEFKGKVAIPGWGWMGSTWFYAVNSAFGGSVSDTSKGLEFVKKLVNDQDAVIMENTDQGMSLFQNGEIVIAPFWSSRTNLLQVNYDMKTEWVIPKEGSIGNSFGFALPKGQSEEKLQAALDLYDFALTPEVQGKWASKTGYPPANPRAVEHVDEKTLEKYPTIKLSDEQYNRLAKNDIKWEKVPQHRDDDASKWRRIVQK